ncbi:MAG: hypothetical protein H7Z72_21225 [Bacteroidetes bacterium]|nr:hypothetical protein [Fibrella sp.]
MKFDDLLKLAGFLLGLCLVVCLIFCAVIVSKMSFNIGLVDILSIFSSSFTVLGVVATVIALCVAYVTYQNQTRSNEDQKKSTEYSISTATANTIQGNINSIRNALNLAFYENSDPPNNLEYGVRAATLFTKNFKIPRLKDMPENSYQSDYDRLNNYPAQGFVGEVLTQLEFISEIINDIELRREYMKEIDYRQTDNALRTLINYYVRKFFPIFNAVGNSFGSLSNSELEVHDWRLNMIEFFIDRAERHRALTEKLVNAKYLEPVYPPYGTKSSMQINNERNFKPIDLKDRASKLANPMSYYKSI